MLVGGGTGGHILPLLAVAHNLKQSHPKVRILVVIDNSVKSALFAESSSYVDEVKRIKAGKYRRYPNRSVVERLLDIKTFALNIRDFFRMTMGIFQAIWLLKQEKPRIVFIKGGFVGVPIGIACRLTSTPFITHDSDASPGLANRIIGRWAHTHTVAMDRSLYKYPASKTLQVGIPVSADFVKVNKELKAQYRKAIGIPEQAKLILVTGGSLGAKELNGIVANISQSLLADPDIYVIHQTGNWKSNDLPVDNPRYRIADYLNNMYLYSGSADIIITRAGSAIAEFATQQKTLIVVPAPQLADGHQLKNAEIIKNAHAGVVISQDELKQSPTLILSIIDELLANSSLSQTLANNLQDLYPPDATSKISQAILKIAKGQRTSKKQ